MRHITKSQKRKIYFNTPPFFIGEGFCLEGALIPIIGYPEFESFLGLIFLAVGIFFVKRKLQTMKTGFHVLRHGVKTEAILTTISNTNLQHNNRIVKEYNFQYEANGKRLNYKYQSAYRRHLQVGNKMTLFFIEDNPKLSFIPKLYNLDIKG